MSRLLRRLITFVAVAVAVAVGGLYWLHDGDLAAAGREVAAAAGQDPAALDYLDRLAGRPASSGSQPPLSDALPPKTVVAPDPGVTPEDPP